MTPGEDDADIMTCFAHLTQIIESLHSGSGSQAQLNVRLSDLHKQFEACNEPGLREIGRKALNRLLLSRVKDNSSLKDVVSACDELRLVLVISALSVLSPLDSYSEETREIISAVADGNGEQLTRALEVMRGGLIHAIVGKAHVLILPRVVEESQCHILYDELNQLFEKYSEDLEWIMDFSQVYTATVSFTANIVATTQRVRRAGGKLHIGWMRKRLYRGQQLQRIKKFFGLQERAGWYFSSAEQSEQP